MDAGEAVGVESRLRLLSEEWYGLREVSSSALLALML